MVLVRGANGFAGDLVATALERRGHTVVRGSRDTAGVADPPEDVAIVCDAVAPAEPDARDAVARTIESGRHYVGLAVEQPFLRWVHDTQDAPARRRGVSVVPGAGLLFLVGDLLAALAAQAVRQPADVHVAYALPTRGTRRRGTSADTRAAAATLLGRPGLAVVDGATVEEWPGEQRRLAWFPRPVGPRHAAGIPGGEPITVPRHVPGATTVRTSMALTTWRAETLQLAAGAARWAPMRAMVHTALTRGRETPDAAVRARTRWAAVAEVRGRDGALARAWAYGHDPYGTTVSTAAVVIERLAHGAPPGVVAPAQLGDPGDLLDRVAACSDLRWSVRRPGD